MIRRADPRFWLAIARDVIRAVRHPQPVIKPEEAKCPCDCGLTMGERKWLS